MVNNHRFTIKCAFSKWIAVAGRAGRLGVQPRCAYHEALPMLGQLRYYQQNRHVSECDSDKGRGSFGTRSRCLDVGAPYNPKLKNDFWGPIVFFPDVFFPQFFFPNDSWGPTQLRSTLRSSVREPQAAAAAASRKDRGHPSQRSLNRSLPSPTKYQRQRLLFRSQRQYFG